MAVDGETPRPTHTPPNVRPAVADSADSRCIVSATAERGVGALPDVRRRGTASPITLLEVERLNCCPFLTPHSHLTAGARERRVHAGVQFVVGLKRSRHALGWDGGERGELGGLASRRWGGKGGGGGSRLSNALSTRHRRLKTAPSLSPPFFTLLHSAAPAEEVYSAPTSVEHR